MSNNLYMPFHPGDYLTKTTHLSAAEHGAYFLLILNYWQRGEALPADDRKLRAIARLSPDEWQASRETLLEFFDERDGLLYHDRIEEELEKAREKSTKARASAKRSHSVRKANAEVSHSERSANQDQDQEKEEAIASSSDDATISIDEVKRRLEQATGWLDLPGEATILKLIEEGVSFEGRILPLAKDEAARRHDKPRSWTYLATVVRDQSRVPSASVKPVEMAWVPVGSPAWAALAGIKRESYLKTMLKRDSSGREGIWWLASDLPPSEAAA